MEISGPQQDFIKEWLKKKRGENAFNQDILSAIENSLGGMRNEELDETKLLKLLRDIDHGDKKWLK